MAFSNYKDIGSVFKEFQITYTEANFMGEVEFNISDYLREIFSHSIKLSTRFKI